VRFSADPVCRALLSRLDRPLLASTVPCEVDGDGIEYAQDPAVMCDDYESEGLLAFVIDCGVRENPPSTVIDLSGEASEEGRGGRERVGGGRRGGDPRGRGGRVGI
jgi:tRNA A37 threonylcarbamoyladenosine synthetase subunit TsaC/SUA5/YrdC